MSAEGAVSVGAQGASVAAAGISGSGIGTSISGELGSTGIGFDSGYPTFSGLGRSDSDLGAFSVNEGSKGPVLFSNSTDLFSETSSVSPTKGTPEMPVMGNIFSSEMQTLALGTDLGISNPSVTEKPSVFGEFASFQITMPVNEGPAPLSSFDSFTTIATFSEPSIGFESETEQEPQVSIESVVASETAEMGLEDVDIKGAVEDLRTNDPLTYMQLKSDLESVQTILDIVDEVTTAETAASISNVAISTAVERSGLIQALETVSEEPEADAEPSADPMRANVQAIMESVNPTAKETVEQRLEQQKEEYFVHEKANKARRAETARAIKTAFEEDIDPITGKVKGKDVVGHLAPEPSEEEISELVLQEGGKNDGSESQRRNQLSLMEFESTEEALVANERLIAENNAVTKKEASKRATEAEAEKVRNGMKPTITETQIFPLTA